MAFVSYVTGASYQSLTEMDHATFQDWYNRILKVHNTLNSPSKKTA